MAKFGLGQPVLRNEDPRFLTGRGQYVDDINAEGQAFGFVLRSPMAHAVIERIDTEAAEAAPGVLAVYTVSDLDADGLGGLPCMISFEGKDGKENVKPERPALARDKVRYVGEPVAFVVAETAEQARDAAELIEVDYDDLPAVVDTDAADAPDAPQLYDDAPDNVSFVWEKGDGAAVEDAMAKADRVVELTLINNRVLANSMEPRGALGQYDGDRFTLTTSTQGGHSVRQRLAEFVFKIPQEKLRVVTPDVGGGFGMKIFTYPEQVLVLYAARKLARPVKWTSDRSEGHLSDNHGRDHVSRAKLALDRDGRMLGLQVRTKAALGAALSNFAPFVVTSAGVNMLAGVYLLPAVHVEVTGVFTNTTPIDAYRGAGRPEANYVIERMVDRAARQIGMDPAELRRINFIPPDRMPYETAMGLVYDSGEFATVMDNALEAADYEGLGKRKEEAARHGRLRGLGIATYIEACGGGADESGRVRFDENGVATILVGTQNNGQGHETAYPQVVSEVLGIPYDRIKLVQGDTDAVATGRGTAGSRSLPVAGVAIMKASEAIREKCRTIASHLLEAAEADLEFDDGTFTVAGTDRTIAIQDVIKAAVTGESLPEGMEPGLDELATHQPENVTFPNGCHAVEVEIDPDTGTVEIVNYMICDDFGKVVNPLLLAGQVHGGVAQGVGQALLERVSYDPDSGQMLSGSLMDYTMPRAGDLPMIDFETIEVPCLTNPMGIKGAGEAGAIGAPPAVINALVDALAPFGVEHIDMPATPEVVWQAAAGARKQAA